MLKKFCIIRTYSAGVHAGTLKSQKGKEVVLTNSKRVWSWRGANTLHELSLNGPGAGSRISKQVAEIKLTEAIEIIPCSKKAVTAFRDAKWGN